MITIYGSDGMAKTQVPCDDNSTQEMELQGDNALSLSFTLYEHVALEVNDYAEFMGRKYWLMERYHPEQVSTVEWKYDIKLYGIESLVKSICRWIWFHFGILSIRTATTSRSSP